ncbi:MAG: chemotaxis protein CheW [Gammaproteobacteria bacterium]|nr:chemotaxis protein CheW [Gammaproteobacteria bacterium]
MARKSSLREFQRSVAERLRDPSKLRAFASKLGFQVGDENWFVSLSDVAEVIPVPTIVPVPQTKPWFYGVANIRGKLFSIADFSGFQGNALAIANLERRVILLNERLLEASGIVVTRMLGLRNPDTFTRVTVDEADTANRPWIIAQYRDANDNIWLELDVKQLSKKRRVFRSWRNSCSID